MSNGDELAREGAERAHSKLTADEKQALAQVVKLIATRRVPFTSDDVWAALPSWWLDKLRADKRALGAVFLRLRREGFIEPTGEFRKSERAEAHSNPKRVWRRTGSAPEALDVPDPLPDGAAVEGLDYEDLGIDLEHDRIWVGYTSSENGWIGPLWYANVRTHGYECETAKFDAAGLRKLAQVLNVYADEIDRRST